MVRIWVPRGSDLQFAKANQGYTASEETRLGGQAHVRKAEVFIYIAMVKHAVQDGECLEGKSSAS